MQASLTQGSFTRVEAVSSSDAQLESTLLHLHLAPSLQSCHPSKYTTTTWESLRPYLKSRGYRLITQRDIALEIAEATGEPIPDHWNGPPKDDDKLYSASTTGAIFEGYRLSDSRRVTLKIISASDSYEADILSYLRLSDSSVKKDPRNKAIPVLEILKFNEDRVFAVTETWSPYWSLPPVSTWAEFADFIHQVLEGLAYFHVHRIAHLDISDGNILSGPPSAFASTSDPKPPRSYAFIDFELSIMYPPSDPGPFKVTGDVATLVAPEMSTDIEYDPFKADIWQMGTLLTRAAKQRGFEMTPLQELLQAMTREVPEDRPTASQALDAFAAIEWDCRD